MKKTNKTVPVNALCFDDPDKSALAFVEKKDGSEAKIRMTAYSGKVIKDHWYWGDLVLNVHGMSKASSKIPILEDHFTSKKIGFTSRVITDNNAVEFDPDASKLVSTPYAEEFVKLSEEGFPYQCSVFGRPSKIIRLGENESMEVNGFKFSGPGTVWDKWTLKEGSVCTFGYDGKTAASAFSKDQVEELEYDEEGGEDQNRQETFTETDATLEGGETTMTKDELKSKHPEIYEAIFNEGVASAEEKFSAERDGFNNQITTLNTQLSDQGTRIAKMEKDAALNKEKSALSEADRIFAECFSASDVPERWKDKARNQVNHQQFVNDEGDLDTAAFSEAVATELKDWEEKGASSVHGLSAGSRDDDAGDDDANAQQFKKENKGAVSDLLGRAGQRE